MAADDLVGPPLCRRVSLPSCRYSVRFPRRAQVPSQGQDFRTGKLSDPPHRSRLTGAAVFVIGPFLALVFISDGNRRIISPNVNRLAIELG